jgi:hypothetical protein
MRTPNPDYVPATLVERGRALIDVQVIHSTDAAELQRFDPGLSLESRQTRCLSVSPALSDARSSLIRDVAVGR